MAIGAVRVTYLRSVFGSDGAVVTPVGSDTAEKFNPKVVTYEVFGRGRPRSSTTPTQRLAAVGPGGEPAVVCELETTVPS